MKTLAKTILAVTLALPGLPDSARAENKTCFFPAMRQLHQNALYARKGPTVDPMAEGEQYHPSEVACVPVATTMIVRAAIENGKNRFGVFKPDAPFTAKKLPPPIPTTATAVRRAACCRTSGT